MSNIPEETAPVYLADIPVTLCFVTERSDLWDSRKENGRRHATTVTYRVDLDDLDDPGQVCMNYPPTGRSRFYECNLAEHLTSDMWNAIVKAVKRWPEDYYAGPAEDVPLLQQMATELAEEEAAARR
ncbi:hypothetical protein CMI37_11180 [Candidatus Pacearchaeota archaeon]|nr:hypothetical protein [Candidatus Pacearchaeota archaeon]|tara:strand:- start:1144 stop:1524 length:381 start_codon:yes stop_codon:yes gene_type:complete